VTDDHYELGELRGAHSVSPFIVEEFVVLRFEVYHTGGDWYMGRED